MSELGTDVKSLEEKPKATRKRKSLTGDSYKALLSRSQEEIDEEVLEHTVEEAKIQLQSDILNAKRNISTKNRALVTIKSSKSFNSTAIITAGRELKIAEKDLADLELLQTEMF